MQWVLALEFFNFDINVHLYSQYSEMVPSSRQLALSSLILRIVANWAFPEIVTILHEDPHWRTYQTARQVSVKDLWESISILGVETVFKPLFIIVVP